MASDHKKEPCNRLKNITRAGAFGGAGVGAIIGGPGGAAVGFVMGLIGGPVLSKLTCPKKKKRE